MQAMLVSEWNERDPAGLLVSEKLDGVRVVWDGSALWSKSGRRIEAPEWFAAKLPATPVDGELWAGRGKFQTASNASRGGADSPAWHRVRLMAFDFPSDGAARDRVARLASLVSNEAIGVVEHHECRGREDLDRRFRNIVRDGGEGVVLREPAAFYITGVSADVWKIKHKADLDAVVLGVTAGRGRNEGSVGALRCRAIESGAVFKVSTGLSDASREHPPKRGDVVIVRHEGVTHKGTPKSPVFVGIRADGGAKSFRAQIAERVAGLGMRQADVATASGIPQGKVSEYLSGKKDFNAETLERLIKVLGGQGVIQWSEATATAAPAKPSSAGRRGKKSRP